MNGRGEVGSPDPLDSFPPLRVRQSDGASRHSSCDGDSEFERYCSANSMMGTPSTSMSMCSAITLFHDFSDVDFGSGRAFEDANNASEKRNFRYGSSGLELYGDCSDELAMTELDSSELIVFNRTEVSNANENRDVRVGESGMDGFELEIGEREMERGEEEQQEEEREEEKELSEDEDSMYNYGSDGDSGNESFLSRSIQYHHREPEERNENPFFMNSSVAFGSQDLDDFLLQSGQGSVTNDLFCNQQEKDFRVEEDDVNSASVSSSGFGRKEAGKDEKDMVTHNEEVEGTKDIGDAEPVKEVRDIPAVSGQVQRDGKLDSGPVASSISKDSEEDLVQLAVAAPQNRSLNVTDGGSKEKEDQHVNSEGAIAIGDAQHANPELDNSKFKFVHFHDSRVDQNSSSPSIHIGNRNAQSDESLEQIVPHSNSGMRKTSDSSSTSTNLLEKSHVIFKKEDFELNEFYDEVVQEMEEILLDFVDSPGTRHAINRLLEPQLSMPTRDGGLTASTSSTDDAYLLAQTPRRIDRIEVVGARQKKGDVSFSERLVGVKEYTLYKIKVWSGKDQWEVERRYRDFLALHRCMKALFNEQGWILPLPWCSIEKESKIFGSVSPDIIVKRSILIQECLQSILHTRFFSSPPKALIWFLSPQDSYPVSPASNSFTQGETIRKFSTLGKTISLLVEIPPNKSMKQLLEAQHHTCAGCHKHFDDGKTLIWDFVTTFGWGKARLCEYTGQLFCSSCHTNETAVLPARVLHHWDFTHYPVSQLAKSYLDSIHEQPMLCVTAVNPFLLSKVPAMLHVMSVRKKIATMLPYVRCPFRRSINRGLGNRRYLLESNDFFALRDLIDLSKGVFAALPVMVETLSRKILEHVTDQCLICCDAGVPCSARQDCSDPSSLIFPFQEDGIERCKSCQMVFHKRCFRKLANCPCRAQLRLNETRSLTNRVSQRGSNETKGALDLLGRGLGSSLSPRILSGLFTKQNSGKIRERKDENIILMGSLPSNSL